MDGGWTDGITCKKVLVEISGDEAQRCLTNVLPVPGQRDHCKSSGD